MTTFGTNNESPFDGTIAICAFRYALGRRSYVVGRVAEWLMQNRRNLSEFERELIVREIDDADRVGERGIGMDMDRLQWMEVRQVMSVHLR